MHWIKGGDNFPIDKTIREKDMEKLSWEHGKDGPRYVFEKLAGKKINSCLIEDNHVYLEIID